MKVLFIVIAILFATPIYAQSGLDDIDQVEEELNEIDSFEDDGDFEDESDSEDEDEITEFDEEDNENSDIGDEEDEDIEALLDDEMESDSSEDIAEDDADEDFDNEDFDDEDSEEIATDEPNESIEEDAPVEEVVEAPEPEVVEDDTMAEEIVENDLTEEPLFDEPDYAFESRLADIYVNFYSQPMSEDEWSQLIQNGRSESYDIQAGDTLWDISATIFGDGNYWPKIWSLNSKIANPHVIETNRRIQFMVGDENYAPSVNITEAPQEGEEDQEIAEATDEVNGEVSEEAVSSLLLGGSVEDAIDENEPQQVVVQQGGVEIPPPLYESKPVLKSLPPSLPDFVADSREYDDAGIYYGERPVFKFKRSLDLNYLFVSEVPDGIAKIVEVESGSNIAMPNQYVFIQALDNTDMQKGTKLFAYESIGNLVHDSEDASLRRSGFSLRVLGEVEVVEKVESRYKGQVILKALVTKAIFPVTKGAKLQIGSIKQIVLEQGQTPNKTTFSQIIGGKFSLSRKFYSEDSIVFLNQGANQGLQVGDQLYIRKNRAIRSKDSLVADDYETIGRLQVAHVESNIATAVVVEASREIQTYDITGTSR